MSIYGWMGKKIVVYSTIKKDKILPLVTAWVDIEGIMLREIRLRNASAI